MSSATMLVDRFLVGGSKFRLGIVDRSEEAQVGLDTRSNRAVDRNGAEATSDIKQRELRIPTADTVRPLETHAEWRAADVTDPTKWTLFLTDEHHVELDAALANARSKSDNVLDITAADFPLPTLGPLLSAMAHELIDGVGFARIARLDIDRLGAEDATWIYWGIGMHLGTPWPQNAKGHLLGDVRDSGKSINDPDVRGYELGGTRLDFHSDASDLVGLLCLHPGVSGGESLVTNAVYAHNELVRKRPDLAAALYEPLPYDYRGEQRPGGRPYYRVPVFARHADRLFVRYIPAFIRSSQRHPEAPRLTDLQLEAMSAYEALIHDRANRVEMALAAGDIQFVNNYHVLHARNRYVDDAANGQVRWLKRLWLATNVLGPGDRPERYQSRSVPHWGERRSRA